MRKPFKVLLVIGIAVALVMSAAAIFWRKTDVAPPVITVHLLGYTNRTGPFAILAITNRSPWTVTLDPQSVVRYEKPARHGLKQTRFK